MKILVVEDDRTVGQYVKRGLEEQRYQADLVDDGMEGLRLASGGRYDLIVLDLRLPGMNGFEMLRTLRDRGTTTPVLVRFDSQASSVGGSCCNTTRRVSLAVPEAGAPAACSELATEQPDRAVVPRRAEAATASESLRVRVWLVNIIVILREE